MTATSQTRAGRQAVMLAIAAITVQLSACSATPMRAGQSTGAPAKAQSPTTVHEGVLSTTPPVGAVLLGKIPLSKTPARGLPGLIVVGLPRLDRDSGAVDVFFPDERHQRLTPDSLGLPRNAQPRPGVTHFNVGYSGYTFGTSLAQADLNGDGLSDLVVGSPGDRWEDDTAYAVPPPPAPRPNALPGFSGRVWILLNSDHGFTHANAIPVPISPVSDDQLGSSLALSHHAGDDRLDLWIGSPGRTVNGHRRSGLVYEVGLDEYGKPTLIQSVSLGSPLIPGSTADGGEEFGTLLVSAPNGVMVGLPNQTVNGTPDAGEVIRLRTNRLTNRLIDADVFTQASPGVAGDLGQNNRFGAAISDDGLAVSASSGDGPRLRHGMIQMFIPSASRPDSLVPTSSLQLGSLGPPGRRPASDAFATDVAVGNFTCPDVPALAIGTPGGGDPPFTRGTVTIVSLPGAAHPCPTILLQKASRGQPDGDLRPYTNIFPGPALAVIHPGTNDPTRLDRLLISVPRTSQGALWSGSAPSALRFASLARGTKTVEDGQFGLSFATSPSARR